MKRRMLFAIMLLMTSASQAEEPIILKQRNTWSSPFLSITKDKDLMPGNDSFGFFYKNTDNKSGICRVRSKVSCEYGLQMNLAMKNQGVLLMIEDQMLSQVTDHEGILDLLFRCPKEWQNLKVQLTVAKYESSFILKDAPQAHSIPDGKCK